MIYGNIFINTPKQNEDQFFDQIQSISYIDFLEQTKICDDMVNESFIKSIIHEAYEDEDDDIDNLEDFFDDDDDTDYRTQGSTSLDKDIKQKYVDKMKNSSAIQKIIHAIKSFFVALVSAIKGIIEKIGSFFQNLYAEHNLKDAFVRSTIKDMTYRNLLSAVEGGFTGIKDTVFVIANAGSNEPGGTTDAYLYKVVTKYLIDVMTSTPATFDLLNVADTGITDYVFDKKYQKINRALEQFLNLNNSDRQEIDRLKKELRENDELRFNNSVKGKIETIEHILGPQFAESVLYKVLSHPEDKFSVKIADAFRSNSDLVNFSHNINYTDKDNKDVKKTIRTSSDDGYYRIPTQKYFECVCKMMSNGTKNLVKTNNEYRRLIDMIKTKISYISDLERKAKSLNFNEGSIFALRYKYKLESHYGSTAIFLCRFFMHANWVIYKKTFGVYLRCYNAINKYVLKPNKEKSNSNKQ